MNTNQKGSLTPVMISNPEEYRVPLIGRLEPLGQLRRMLQATRKGRVQTVFVQGEAGIGKTRLVSAISSEAMQEGWHVLQGRAQKVGEGLAFAPVIEAFRMALHGMEDTQKVNVGNAFPYLNAFFPELGGVLPVSLLDPALERTRLFETLRMFTVHLAATQPLIFWIDDLPEADVDTLEWLQYCLQHTTDDRIVFLATCRSTFEPPSAAYRQLETSLLRHGLLHTIQLHQLPVQESIELVRAHLSEGVQESAMNALISQALGVPLYLVEMMHMLVQSGALCLQEGSWVLKAGVEARVPPSITSLLEHRLEHLSPSEHILLTLFAVSDSFIPWSVLQKALDWDSDQLSEAVSGLIRNGIVREETSGHDLQYDFRHPMLKGVATARVTNTMSRQAHVKLANAWIDSDVSKAAFHILASGSASDLETSVKVLFEAGKRFLSLRSYQAATEYLEQATYLIPQRGVSVEDSLRWEIRLTLSEALTYVDRAPQSLHLLEELFHESWEPLTKIRLKRLMAWVESTRSYEDCVRHLEEGLAGWDGQSENADVLWMLNERVFNDLNSGDLVRAEVSLLALQQYAQQFPSLRTALLCMCREVHVSLLSWHRPSANLAQADRMLAQARQLGEPELIYDAYCLIGYQALNQGDYKTALRYSTECAALVRRNGMVVHEVSVRLVGMCALFLAGEWEKSLQEAEDVKLLALEYEIHGAVVCTLDLTALILVLQGQQERGFAVLQESEQLAQQVFPSGGPHTSGTGLHVLRAVDSLFKEASPKQAQESKSVYWANAHGLQVFLKLIEGLWLLRAGLEDGVVALLEQLQTATPDQQPNYVSGIVELLSGLLAERRLQDDEAQERLACAVRTFEALRTPLELALSRVVWARQVEQEDPSVATQAWQQSLDELNRIGASAFAEWVAQYLASKIEVNSLDVLSARELEIAKYVTQGLTNKEIAELLQLSPRTISTHLEKIYRKVNVHSRTALSLIINENKKT